MYEYPQLIALYIWVIVFTLGGLVLGFWYIQRRRMKKKMVIGKKISEPILFRDLEQKCDFKSKEIQKKTSKQTREQIPSQSGLKDFCSNCKKIIPRNIAQCPHCFEKINPN